MFTVWIIHRDAQQRLALARIASVGDRAVLGGPLDPVFESAAAPRAIVLGLSGDFEQELEFVHRFGTRFPKTPWILLAPPSDLPETQRLFDTLPARFIGYPPRPEDLRGALRDSIRKRKGESLSERRERTRLRDRFARWFADIEIPELLRALDPRQQQTPVLIRGESGTGRGLLARYIHAFGHGLGATLVPIRCQNISTTAELLEEIRANGDVGRPGTTTIWLEDLDRLSTSIQRHIQDWITYGGPDHPIRTAGLRFIAGVSDESGFDQENGLDPRLAEALAGITLRLPPLRERGESIDLFVHETSLAWTAERGEPARSWAPETLMLLQAYPWPGNMHELEGIVSRTLAFTSAEPVLPVHLRFPGDSGWLDRYASPDEGSDSDEVLEPIDQHSFAEEASEAMAAVEERELPEADVLPENDDDTGAFSLRQLPETNLEFDVFPQSTEPGSAMTLANEAMANILAPSPQEGTSEIIEESEETRSELRQMVRALVHDVRNPLVSIRTFSELLPEHYDDPEFRNHFSELVGRDVGRINEAVTRLHEIIDLTELKSAPVDIAALLESLLEQHRDAIQERRLLVLKELDHNGSNALGDSQLLRDAFSALIERAIASTAERGDIYLASRQHPSAQSGHPTLRVLIRFGTQQNPAPAPGNQLDRVMAQSIIRALGGTFTEDTTDSDECVVVVDLPTPD